MFESYIKGFSIFKNKKILFSSLIVYFLYLGIGVLIYDFIYKYFHDLVSNYTLVKPIQYLQILFTQMPRATIYLFLIIFGMLFLLHFLIYIISLSHNKFNNQKIITKIPKVLIYTLTVSLAYFFLLTLLYLTISYSSIITLIIMIFLFIILFVVTITFTLSNIFLGLYDSSIKDAFRKGYKFFINKRFWGFLLFLIMLFIFVNLFYLLLNQLYIIIFEYNSLVSTILVYFIAITTMLYTTSSISYYLKKHTKDLFKNR